MKTHARVLSAILSAFLSVLSYAQAPVPFVNQPLVPDATAPGGAQFTLTVNGTGFLSSSVVNWNGSALATQFIRGSQLTATVPVADIATASTASITVINPAPGGGTSNVAFFTVRANTGSFVGFAPIASPSVGSFRNVLALGDFNGDGKLDLAVTDYIGNKVSILLGDGKGNFTPASSLTVGKTPGSLAVGDFNGDGNLDLVVSNSGTLSILLGDGTGNLILASSPTIDGGPVRVGDFNGDGKLDLAVGRSILLGDGTGNFILASSLPASALAVGDFNGDGNLDLAALAGAGVSILLGDGTGNFVLGSSAATRGVPQGLTVGDFNGDGNLDLATANYENNSVSILLGDGTGNFVLSSYLIVGVRPSAVAVGDFNGDGNLDLAVGNTGSRTLSILMGDGTGHFTLALSPPAFEAWSLGVGDFNGDGILDLAATSADNSVVSILLGVETGLAATLSPPSLSFGTQLIGTSSYSRPVTLTNNGSETLDTSKPVASGAFSQTNNCPRQLQTGKQCIINVTFTPRYPYGHNGMLTIADNASDSPQTVLLSGIGTVVNLSPSNLNFGNQSLGTTSPPQTVTLTNNAPKALGVGKIQINPNFAQTNNCGTSVTAGGSCTISVTFTPKRKGPGTVPLLIYDNGGGSPQTVLLTGVGTAVSLSQSSLNFGSQPVGTTSQPQTVTLTNHAPTVLSIGKIYVYPNFAQTNDCGTSVAAGGSCTISVTFTPTRKGSGTASLVIHDNGGDSPQTVSLSGTGT